MTTFEYTSFDLLNPAGNNGLSSFALYFQRALYKEAIYPKNVKLPLDTWYEKAYYGRIDRQQNTIAAKYENLRPVPSSAVSNLLCLNFVADAFSDFVTHMKNAFILGMVQPLNANEKIYNMKAYVAYNDPARIYSEYGQQLFNSFVSGLSAERKNQITDFETFVDAWFFYLQTVASYIPVTKTSYLISNVGNSFNSGLSIAIDRGPSEDDNYKYKNWIDDRNFKFYVDSAKKFGFIVNKNMPWILTADLFSDACLAYIEKYTEEDNFFDYYYNKTYTEDIQLIKTLTINAYKTFIKNNPIYEKKTYLPNCDKTKVDTFNRDQTLDEDPPELKDKKLVDLYLSLRSTEAKNPIPLSKDLNRTIADLYNAAPSANGGALVFVSQFINSIYRDYIYQTNYLLLDFEVINSLDKKIQSGTMMSTGQSTQQTSTTGQSSY
mgnify:CR=1 FL=1